MEPEKWVLQKEIPLKLIVPVLWNPNSGFCKRRFPKFADSFQFLGISGRTNPLSKVRFWANTKQPREANEHKVDHNVPKAPGNTARVKLCMMTGLRM